MKVQKYIKQLFSGRKAMETQICLFSLAGIFVLLFAKYTASWGNLFYNDFYIAVPSSNLELWFYLFAGIVIAIYFTGFGINLMRTVITRRTFTIPPLTLRPFIYFVKALPYILYLSLSYLIILVGGVLLLLKTEIPGLYYTYASILICMIPFFMMMFIRFLKTMSLSKSNLNLLNIFKIMELTLGDVILWSLNVFIRIAIQVFIYFQLLVWDIPKSFLIPVLPFKLAVVVFGTYISLLFNLVYLTGLADILKEKVK